MSKLKIFRVLYPARMWLQVFVCTVLVQTAFGQSGITVSGTVTDETGETLVGVTVRIKDSAAGTVTDISGNYSMTVPANATLVFSFVGLETQEQVLQGRRTVDVVMAGASSSFEELVVTGFATQRRVNVTGSISVVGGDELMAAPVSNISNALVGLTPGISALQASGEPGRNAADITIRGVSTYNGNTEPLIVIDGIEQAAEQAFAAFNNLDPNDILGISVLKDASSTAVYGIRAANGVIIVTTKRGQEGKPRVSVSTNFGLTKATSLQKGLSSYEWALFRNEAVQNEMDAFGSSYSNYLYSDMDLWKFQNNRDFHPDDIDAYYKDQGVSLTDDQRQQALNSPALYYGSSDMYVERFSRLAPQWQTNVNISGGTGKVRYFASLGHFSQEGITNADKYHGSNTGSGFTRYNFRANVDVDVIKNTTLSVNLTGQFGTTHGPGSTTTSSDPYNLTSRYQTIMQIIYDGNPLLSPGIMDGHLISGFDRPAGTVQDELALKTANGMTSQNPVYNLLNSGTGYLYNTLLDNTIRIKHVMPYLTKGLYVQASMNYQDNYTRYTVIRPSLPTYTVRRSLEDPNVLEYFGGGIGGDAFSSTGNSNWNKLYLDAGIYYDNSFGVHNVGALFLGKAYKYIMPGGAYNTPSGNLSLVGRVTYDYDQRYMAELNVAYNGTEQFDEGNRFGFFPAFSAGWVPSNESFFPKTTWFTFLKIRGSYGQTGNDQLGGTRYLYLPNTYNLNQDGYYFGTSDGFSGTNSYYAGAIEGNLGNPNVTWEKEAQYDIGIETRWLNDRLSFSFDWFSKERNNILTTRSSIIPGMYGVASGRIPAANVGITSNEGYDVVLSWEDRARGGFGYNIEGYMSYARNKIVYMAEAPNPYPWMGRTGFSIGQRHGLKNDGLYNTLEELNARPSYELNNNRQTLGDIKYIDLNGDGFIDELNDRAPIGYPNRPMYQFGLKLGFNYRGFDLRMLFNGTAKGSFMMSRIQIPFYKVGGNAFRWQYDGRWTPEKYAAGEVITYPRATFDSGTTSHNFLQSDYWMIPNDFFKLKNVELGYTFPATARFMQASGISSLRVYANGNNIYTIYSKLKHIGIDPETREPSNYTYVFPITTTVTFGLNIQF